MAINNKCFLLREGSVGPGEAGAKVGMEWKPGAWYLQQGQGPRAADATAAERTSGSEDTSLVQHLVPEMRTGRCLWVPTGQSSPSQPQVLSSRGPPNSLPVWPPILTLLTSDIAEHDSGMCSERRGAQTAAKTRQGRWSGTCESPLQMLLPQPSL